MKTYLLGFAAGALISSTQWGWLILLTPFLILYLSFISKTGYKIVVSAMLGMAWVSMHVFWVESKAVDANAEPFKQVIEVGVGARIRAVEGDLGSHDSGYAMGLGGYYRYTIPQANRVSLYASGYYYPSLFAYGDIKRQHEADLRAEYYATRNARIYLSYSVVKTEFNDYNDTYKLDEGVHVGVAAYF